ncbi:MAG: substrate-binding domain-containing protein [Lachnospiraceae bacterium]|jgi:rhamnose transport system substrate-binding protein|nr:substrate-binding domain-containing protein [Lachnospiraceae bacterium]
MKKILAMLLLTAMVGTMILSGCSKKETPAEETTEETTETTEETTETTEETTEVKTLNIVFIPKNLGNPYFEAIGDGFEKGIADLEATGEYDITYEMTGPATPEATTQIEYIEAAVQKKADVIFIAPNSNDALNSTFDDARAAGTKIVIINGDIPGSEDHRDAAIMPCNFDNVAKAQIELMGSYIGYKGQFAVLSATTDAPDQNYWVDGMKEIMADKDNYEGGKYKDMELVDVVYGDDLPEKSTTEMEALLTKYPDLAGVICPTTVGIAAATKVVETKGIADKVIVTGLGLPSEMKGYVESGSSMGFQLWDPPFEGEMGVYLAVAVKYDGFDFSAGSSFDVNGTSYSILDDGQIMSLDEPKLFDKNNLDEFTY